MAERSEDQIIFAGHISVATLDTKTLVKNLPDQADQNFYQWYIDVWQSAIPQPAELVRVESGAILPNGYYGWTWVFPVMTFAMYNYFKVQFLGSTTARYGNVTVKDFDEDNTAVYLQAVMLKPDEQGLKKLRDVTGGYEDVTWTFIKGEVIT